MLEKYIKEARRIINEASNQYDGCKKFISDKEFVNGLAAEIGVQDGTFFKEFELPLVAPATTDVKVSAISGSSGSICTSSLRGWTETV